MSFMLQHLSNGWQVDQAILSEEDRIVLIRFGHDWDPTCMKMDEALYSIAEKCKNFCAIYLVDITQVRSELFSGQFSVFFLCRFLISIRCTSCTTPAPPCSSSGTNTS